MKIIKLFMFLYLPLTIITKSSCGYKNENINFKQVNKIINESIIFSLDNSCFEFSKIEKLNKKKGFSFVVNPIDSIKLDTIMQFESFDFKGFVKKSVSKDFSEKTFNLTLNNNYKSFNVNYNDILIYSDFLIKYNKFNLTNSEYSYIESIIVKNPRIKYSNKSNEILVELDRFLEYIIDRTFLLITTDKSFNILKIECLEQVKPYIPPPPKPVKGRKYINPDTIKIDW